MTKIPFAPFIALALALGLTACAGLVQRVLNKLDAAHAISDKILSRKAEREFQLILGLREAAVVSRKQANRFDRGKCHVGLPALRRYAAEGPKQRKELREHCSIDIVPGVVTAQ